MKPIFALLVLCVLSFCPTVIAQDTPEEHYVTVYSLIQRGEQLQSKGRTTDAYNKYVEAQVELRKVRDDFPEWNPKLVKYRLEYLSTKLTNASVKPPGGASAMVEGPTGPVELKLKWDLGKRYVIRTDITQSAEMTVPGTTQAQKMESMMGRELAVSALKEREDGGRDMEAEVLALSISVKIPQMGAAGSMSFDTKQSPDKDATNPLAGNLRKLVGGRIKFVTDGAGKVTSVEGLQELMAKLGDTGTGDSPVKGILSEDVVKGLSAEEVGLPGKPVAVGDSWPVHNESGDSSSGGNLVMNLKYTFKGWTMRDNRKCAVLDFAGDVTAKKATGEASAALEGGMVSGTTWFDPALGMVIGESGQVGGTMKVEAMGQSMSTKMRHSVESKLVQVAEVAK